MDTSRLNEVKAPQHFKTRRYALGLLLEEVPSALQQVPPQVITELSTTGSHGDLALHVSYFKS